ncbi:Unknown protein [Striga hermonthica]|uniref:F-box domain-containing protein n=1 Tax=Striga hermonthica TaxID=68872 RepID=A0A9N7RQ69_STRHE|nr:Unknown protein [Striga hermonthica]
MEAHHPAKSRNTSSNSTRDRISHLPQPILHQVLGFLSQEHAVQTSALSKSWRDLGCTRPKIDFHYYSFNENHDKFVLALDKTLQGYHDRGLSLKEFLVNFDPKSISLLQKWIPIVLLNMGVKRFHLESYPDCFDMPSVVFEAENLEELRLANCRIHLPDKLLSKHLRRFWLFDVNIGDEALQKIISGCPSMEYLVIEACESLTTVKACNNSLKHFEYNDCPRNDAVTIDINAPSLESITIVGDSRWFHYRKSFPRLKTVRLHYVMLSPRNFDMFSVDFCCLEELEMRFCGGLEEFQLSSRSIKRLRFGVNGPSKAVLNLPNILCLRLDCKDFPSISLTTDSSEWRSEIYLMTSVNPNNDNEAASLFDKLHELHRELGHSRISLHMRDFPQDLAFSYEGLKELPVIESLTVLDNSKFSFLEAFLNYFFGNFRPRYVQQSVSAAQEYENERDLFDLYMDELMAEQYGGANEVIDSNTVSVTKKYGGVNELVDRLCDIFLMGNATENCFWRQDLEEVSVEAASDENGGKWYPLKGANISEWGLPNDDDQLIRFRLKWRGSSLS